MEKKVIFTIFLYDSSRKYTNNLQSEDEKYVIRPEKINLYEKKNLNQFRPTLFITLKENKFICEAINKNKNLYLFISKVNLGDSITNSRLLINNQFKLELSPEEEGFVYVQYFNTANVIYNTLLFSFILYIRKKELNKFM